MAVELKEIPTINRNEYAAQFHDATTRNASLERLAQSHDMPYATMAVFADFLETFPTVPLKTQTDLGIYHRPYTHQEIVSNFFGKIALEVQNSGDILRPRTDYLQFIADVTQDGQRRSFTEDEFREFRIKGISPSVVPNFLCANTLRTIARHEGVSLENVAIPALEEREFFTQDWKDAMEKAEILEGIVAVKATQQPDSAIAFAQFMRSYPFIPLKITSQMTDARAHLDFNGTVSLFFDKLSQLVIDGVPVKQLASSEEAHASEILNKFGLSVEVLASARGVSIPHLDDLNGRISPFTIANLISAHRILTQYSPLVNKA